MSLSWGDPAHPFVCAMGPISYLLHLLQTNSGPPQLPRFQNDSVPKDSSTARRQAEDAVSWDSGIGAGFPGGEAALVADLVRRQVALIVGDTRSALAAK